MTPFVALVLALAVYRLTVLVNRDVITDPLRRRLQPATVADLATWRRTAGDFIVCPWCVSVWLAAGTLALWRYQGGWFTWVAYGLAFSALAGYLAERR